MLWNRRSSKPINLSDDMLSLPIDEIIMYLEHLPDPNVDLYNMHIITSIIWQIRP